LKNVEGGISPSTSSNGVRKATALLSKTALNNSSRYMPVQVLEAYFHLLIFNE